jgi:hypothetical protein
MKELEGKLSDISGATEMATATGMAGNVGFVTGSTGFDDGTDYNGGRNRIGKC